MARPQKLKRVCKEPKFVKFAPVGIEAKDSLTLSVDEYEAIRLIDMEGISREECATRMGIKRTTAQDIYNSARMKLASCLVNGFELNIDGGSVVRCDGSAGCADCQKTKKEVSP